MSFKVIPKFSIIMANYNNADYIVEAIESVITQSYCDWELIVCDDVSTDDSINKIKKYLDNKKIKFYQNEKNIGYIETLKRMVNLTNNNIICILDSDDTIEENALEEISQAYINNPDVGFLYTQCNYCDKDLNKIHLGFSAEIPKDKTNLHVNSVVAMRTFRKDMYYKTSGYDNEILFAEDIDLTLKFEEVTDLYFLNKPLYNYRVLGKSQTHSFKNTQTNRSSTALAKINAYKRRINTDISNLNKYEIAEILFLGMVSSILALRFRLFRKFFVNILKIFPLFFISWLFYKQVFKKIYKIIKIRRNNILFKI